MNAGELRNRVTIINRDGSEFTKAWAAIEPITAKEKINRSDMEQSVTHRLRIRYQRGIDSTMRVLFQGRVFAIESVLDPEERRKELHLVSEELPPLLDTITIKRMEQTQDEYNIIDLIPLPPRSVQVCIVSIQDSNSQAGNDPVNWQYKATVHCQLGEDIKQGDTFSIDQQGDFFCTEARPGKNFLEVVGVQRERGAERGL